MKTLADLGLFGAPRLYEVCEPVLETELPLIAGWVADLHNGMSEVRAKYHFGRGIAALQLGMMKRLVYLNLDQPSVLLNPELTDASAVAFELWDDCMSFPNLLVRVRRHQAVTVRYRDEHWQPQVWPVQDAPSELLQHECDHLDGILCIMRALGPQLFRWRPS
ncbi:peptide deformylase [Hymenobacter convexus]|uniref:peptide deformylase n=1 Tax=Hymenobacter sp. CA1UV-4 TaxID=3063782 RepID=UPI00271227AC|nr:peptide deformylase [Hymenobacter sp. CA1UV-4]MDO7851230.1 peptide deformylase [Hymenobacter sp. CA1UV-4]